MSRRALTLTVAGVLTLALGGAGSMMPVPYVVLSPGPTENTIGEVKGKPVISITGRQVYPTEGELNLVTVAYRGGPGNRVDLFTALHGWVNPDIAVVPEETIFPKTSSVQEVERQNTQEMANSQQLATAAALNELGIEVEHVVAVEATEKGAPADGRLQAGDRIVSVDGVPVHDTEGVAAQVRKHRPGEQVEFVVERSGERLTEKIGTISGPDGRPLVGVRMRPEFKFPFQVDITVGDVGGPSAGLMFSLGIYDKLTPGGLTGGKSVAGTGTITADGKVGAIGGIQQKMVGAKEQGATIFLTPVDNCPAAREAVPDGLRLVKVDTLRTAIQALDALRTGKGDVPSC